MSHFPSPRAIELLLFWNGQASTGIAVQGQLDGVVVDCERSGKDGRQHGFDTEINACRPADVAEVRRAAPALHVLCRINGFDAIGEAALEEARQAVDAGASEILLPMVRSFQEMDAIVDAVRGQADVSIMVETEWAVAHASQCSGWPLRRVFVGLNDLMIERGSRHLFENVVNGTVEQVREQFPHKAFGFGGLTLPERGSPLPCRLLMAELARLGCQFTFLRRSFYRDLRATGEHPEQAVARIRAAWHRMLDRSTQEIEADHAQFQAEVHRLLETAG